MGGVSGLGTVRVYPDVPPSRITGLPPVRDITEFIRFCEKALGVPSSSARVSCQCFDHGCMGLLVRLTLCVADECCGLEGEGREVGIYFGTGGAGWCRGDDDVVGGLLGGCCCEGQR